MLKALKRLDGQNNRHAQEGERRPVIATTGEILAHDEDEEFESELANRGHQGPHRHRLAGGGDAGRPAATTR